MKNHKKNLCIIQARSSSTRLPGKIFLMVKGKSLLEYQLARIKLAEKVDKIVVATTVNRADDRTAALCEKIGVDCFRGSEDDVLDRYYRCALNYPDYENIIRITGDCPLIDPKIIDELLIYFDKNKKLDFAGNVIKRTYPHGMDVEIFRRAALAESAEKALLPRDREHVDEYILNSPRFKKGNISAPDNFSHFRLTVDYEEDFKVVKFLIENSGLKDNYLKYISLLSKHPEIMFLNINYNNDNNLLKSWALIKKKVNAEAGKEKQTIVVLGGGLIKDKGGWRTTNLEEGDKFGLSGDRLRIIAAKWLAKSLKNSDYLIIASGGKGQLKDIPGAPAISSVIKKELVEIGLPKEKIIEERASGNTFQQLEELKKMIKEKKLNRVTIISNKHHLPRINAFIDCDAELKPMKNNELIALKAVAAEDIVLKFEPKKWKKVIAKAMKSKAMKERIALEKKGVRQIKDGTYIFS